MTHAKKKCKSCEEEFIDRTKDQRFTKCRTCRNTRVCRKCKNEFYNERGSGFCKNCVDDAKVDVAGYLDDKVKNYSRFRGSEAREQTYETKHGVDS